MKKINLLVALGICSMTLVACSGSKSEPSPNDHSVVQSEESVEKETTSVEEEGLDTLDPETKKELEKLNDEEEEIDWDKVHLTKRQYKEYIESLSGDKIVDNEDEEGIAIVSSKMANDREIEITLNNPDNSEISEITNQFFAVVMDSFSRQLYLHSDFSKQTQNPLIVIKDTDGTIISEETDFIELNTKEED